MSKEHIWPKWMGRNLSPSGPTQRLEILESMNRKHAPFGEIIQRRRDGGTHTKKIRAVCAACNNGWMSSIEMSAQKYLEPMMEGKPLLLDIEAQRVIAEWIALKVLVIDHDPPMNQQARPVFPQPVRDAFIAAPAVPPGFKIWIGKVGGTVWRQSILRFSSGISVSAVPLAPHQLPPDSTGPNIQTVTWGIGHLLVYVIATTDLDVDRKVGWDVVGILAPLWPLTGQVIYWPNTPALSDHKIHAISRTLSNLTRSGRPIQIGSGRAA